MYYSTVGLLYSEGKYFPNCSVRERKALSLIHPFQYRGWINKTIYTLWDINNGEYQIRASRILEYSVSWRCEMEVMFDPPRLYDVDVYFSYKDIQGFLSADYLPVLFTDKQLAKKLARYLSSDPLDDDSQLRFDRWCRKMLTRMKEC